MEEKLKAWIDVKQLRLARGWLQQEAAQKLGVSRSYLSAVEHGKRGISVKMMQAIIKAFKVKYEDFQMSARPAYDAFAILDSVPLAITVWDKNLKLFSCGQYTVDLLGFSSKKDLTERFMSFVPEYQPDGKKSIDVMKEALRIALETGGFHGEWTHLAANGDPVEMDVLLARMQHGNEPIVVVYANDIRSKKRLQTDMKQLGALLCAQTHQYESILDVLPFPVRVADEHSNWIFVNAAAEKLFGRSRSDMLGKPCDHNKFCICGTENCSLVRAKQGLLHTSFEHEDSAYQVEVAILKNQAGELSGFIEMIYDVTEVTHAARRQADAENRLIRMAEERVRLMLDATPLACRLWDKNFNIIECNEAAVQLYELKNKREYLDRFFDLLPEFQPDGQNSIDKIYAGVTEAFEKGVSVYNVVFQMLDGTPIPAENMLFRVRYGDDYVVAAYSRDLREHKKMISGIEKRDYLLQTVNRVADILLRANPGSFNDTLYQCMGIMARAIDADRMFIFMNHTVNGELYCNQIYEWSGDVPSFQDSEITTNICFNNEAPETMKILQRGDCLHNLIRSISPSDRAIYEAQGILAVLLMPVFIHDKFWGFVGFDNCHEERLFTDTEVSIMRSGSLLLADSLLRNEYVTNMQNTSAELQKALAEAETANNAKSSFLASMSHEIRTPLNAIMGIAEIFVQNETLPAHIMEGLSKIHNSCSLLLGIINDILDFSKIEADKLDITPAVYETAGMVNDSVHLNIGRIGGKPITFTLEIDETIPAKLIGDELRIMQILNNLLSNAFKYTDSGKVTLRVRFQQAENDQLTLILEVLDTGCGMTTQQINNLFDEYVRFQLETNRVIEGTGLGMAITARLVNLMNGSIRVESEPGRGSLFAVSLPQGIAGREMLGHELAEKLRGFNTSLVINRKKIRLPRDPMPYGKVLVVDDMETNMYVTEGLLRLYDLQIDTAMSGQEAIDKIKNGNVYDIVFMDHMMPGIDGVEATRHLRSLGYQAPIVALTANAVAKQTNIFSQNGFDDFIAKPIDTRQLDSILNRMVRDKQRTEVITAARKQKKAQLSSAAHASSPALDPLLQASFLRDARKAAAALENWLTNEERESGDQLQKLAITVHGMKSTLANIGEAALSAVAKELELIGKAGDAALFTQLAPDFLQELQALIKQVAPHEATADAHTSLLREKLYTIWELCNNYDRKSVTNILCSLYKGACSKETRETLDSIMEAVLHSDFEEAGEIAAQYASSLPAPDLDIQIDGLDVARGLDKYEGNEKTYIKILRSYASSLLCLLDVAESADAQTLAEYETAIHSLKGASCEVFADSIGQSAACLEDAAKAGNVEYIRQHHPAFHKAARQLADNIMDMLNRIDAKAQRPQMHMPDDEALFRVAHASAVCETGGMDDALSELDVYDFDADDGLVRWLQNEPDVADFTSIVEKLSGQDTIQLG